MGLLPLVSARFQVLFTPLTGVLFAFRSRYCSLSVTREYLALQGGPCGFTPGFTGRALLGIAARVLLVSPTGLSPAMAGLSRPFDYEQDCSLRCRTVILRADPTTPHMQRSRAYTCTV
jgi:hypothetical protein